MKILFVAGGVPSPIGQSHILDLLRFLHYEHEFTVVCFDLGESFLADSRNELHSLAEARRFPLARKSLLARGLHSLVSLTPVAVQGFDCQAMRRELAKVCGTKTFDLVIFEQLVMGQYGDLIGNNTPKLMFPVDAVSRIKLQRSRASISWARKLAFALDYLMTRRYEKRLYRQFDGVLFVSDVDAAYTLSNKQADPSKVFVLPLAVDTTYFTPSPRNSQTHSSVVFLGNMFNYNNEDAVLWFQREIWGRLKSSFPALRFYIVGNHPGSRIKQIAAEDSQIVVTGYLEDIRPPVWNATVFVSPLRMGTGIKNRMLQAMAMAKAIVASPLSCEGISINDGNEVLVADNADTFYEKTAFLLQHPMEREQLSRNARRLAEEHYSVAAKASNFLTLVRQLRNNPAFGQPTVTAASAPGVETL